jgi:hypothetical protein
MRQTAALEPSATVEQEVATVAVGVVEQSLVVELEALLELVGV